MDTSYLSQQVTTIIERLHGFFDEIGVASHERDSRESELFSALSETLHNQLNLVAKEKHDLTEEAQRLIAVIRQMERSLDDSRPDDDYEGEHDGLKVAYPLLDCIQTLKEKHHTIAKLHRERYEQVKKLVEALESYASHLESSFVLIQLPLTSPNAKVPPNFDLSPTYVSKLDSEFTRVYEEYNKRLATTSQLAEEIIGLWSELGTPQAQVDSQIVQCAHEAPEQLGLHEDDLKRLTAKRDKLIAERQQRERKLKDLRTSVEALWDRLSVEESERKQFLASNRGCGLRQINEYEDELHRLNDLKRQNLHLFVEDARFKLQELWDNLYFSEDEMLAFPPAFSDTYTDALLSAHEQEIVRLEALREQRAPILAAVDRHRQLIKEREDLAQSSQDASRLMSKGQKGEKRDPGKLLREEKMRKRITKELPRVEADLRRTLEAWEDEYGRPFCVHGERYLDELDAAQAKPAPPRSKTPNALQPVREAPKSGGRAQQVQSRAGTLRGPPPPRSHTPTITHSRNPMSASVMSSSVMSSSISVLSNGKASPSKIPGATRLPMSTLRDGPNSPERRVRPVQSQQTLKARPEDLNSTVRGRMGPPPPKMRDLFVPPTPTSSNGHHDTLHLERSASVVRHIEPEDPYSDEPTSYRTPQLSSMRPPPRPAYGRATPSQESFASSSYAPSSRPISRQDYPVAPPSRATSNTSSINSIGQKSDTVSGSENWETYSTDHSDNEDADAADAYYAKVRAQQSRQQQQQKQHPAAVQQLKRPGTATQQLGMRKREHVIAEETGSEAGWTDDGEGGVGSTY
ncbi:Microtubule bundling protein [Friedmanniomyces endolithicus]|nr:Microtubule bundling protein [Friedmanniomyces endolithicus]KAK0785319.1 Microtubule bundling protein [Friedmanniomyces endolithicus]KAK0846947.1 Microtubule bundling protein [Friedmanniomyces endolithicus]KAK0863794.1 Microtubule bundling protein [Friedmanniomyces endolithicus]KAK0876224.1 Microtubule bundling protein [Friedmanniomyces endolithicus]